MRVLARKFWEEPAIATAVLLAAVLALGEALIGDGLTNDDLPAILAVFGVGPVARRFVTPTRRRP